MPKDILWFKETEKEDLPLVGGKAANLGVLFKANIPVPNGFSISSSTYFRFLEENSLVNKINKLLSNADLTNNDILNEASNLIKKAIISSPLSADLANKITENYTKLFSGKNGLVAVRSSATAEDLPESSFAGQQSTYLNIRGKKQLLLSVKNCWASLFEARAIFYRHDRGFDHLKIGMSVVVQEMVQSEASGVMFTIDPVENDKNKIIIESVWGLGELIVQGAVTPDHYEISKNGFKITEKQIASQEKQLIKVGNQNKEIPIAKKFKSVQKLPDEKIVELARLGKKIEDIYGFPQDIEWAYSDEKIRIVQTRPVTTIKEVQKSLNQRININLPLILKGAPASPGIAVGMPKVIFSPKEIHKIKPGDILVTTMTNPDFVPAMRKAAAIVTDKGGRTSHAAIVSRELGIPCVVGTEKATKLLEKAKWAVTVSGTDGKVYKGSLSPAKMAAIEHWKSEEKEAVRLIRTATKVFVNLGEKELAYDVAKRPVDGIGLLRAEFMIGEIGIHPKKMIADGKSKIFIDKLANDLKIFAEAFDDKPVIYRATDFKSNEYADLKGGQKYEEPEPNPLMGYRGAYRYISDPEVFEMEIEAIKLVRNKFGFKNIWLMIPFVRTIKEMELVKKQIASAGLYRSPSFKLLMMVEIPSNVILIDKFLDLGIDGVSIGSNDLTMLTLGLDRDNAKVAEEFNELDESVLWSIEHVIKECRKRKLYVGICGQAPSIYPELTKKLVGWGISSISVSPDSIEKTREIIYESEKALVSSR